MKRLSQVIAIIILTMTYISVKAEYEIPWTASTLVNAGGGKFSPYFIASNSGGIFTQPAGIYERAGFGRPLSSARRFEYGFGAEAVASFTEATGYERFDADKSSWNIRNLRQPYIWIQELWGAVKFRGVFLSVGMKTDDRSLFDSDLGIGDIVVSRNARPVPQVRIGFIDFQNIPFTHGWVQIQAEAAYGKFTDSGWLRDHYNYYNGFLTTGVWFHYKRCYFRTNPDQPFSVTVGMQHAAQFGGWHEAYSKGTMYEKTGSPVRFRDFIDVFVQKRGSSGTTGGDQQYYNGNHLGSWDFRARYRFHDGSEITGFFQWPWEDGSGIGKQNGWDGVWGLEYQSSRKGWIDHAMLEYVDFTNQSGPIHWAPGDHQDTSIPGEATGADNYYNNYFYNGWANYGMSMGTPFLKSPLYNRDGYLSFTDNRIRGFQIGLGGTPVDGLSYRLLVAWRSSLGTPVEPAPERRNATSAMVEAIYSFPKIKGLSISGQLAFDTGTLSGHNYGMLVGLTYEGLIKFRNKR